MLFVLDIGNTAVTYGVYQKHRLLAFGSDLHVNIPKIINKWSISGKETKNKIVIGSVVPKNTLFLKKWVSHRPDFKLWIAGQNLPIPIRTRYENPKKLGIDRLVNVFGALKRLVPPLLVIDFGTAVTFDYVSRLGTFEGGLIIPGPEVAFQSLIGRAALLPKTIRLPRASANFIGRNTYDCMASGILEGYGAMTDGLIERFKKRYGSKLKVLATGGFALPLKPFTRSIDIVDPRHSIKSLFLLSQQAAI